MSSMRGEKIPGKPKSILIFTKRKRSIQPDFPVCKERSSITLGWFSYIMTSATVTIRPIGWNDAESLQETLDDPAVYLPCGLRDSTGEFDISEFVKNRIAGWESGAAYSFVVLASDKLVGGCTLHMARGNRQRAEIGFWIQRVFWGKSIATRA